MQAVASVLDIGARVRSGRIRAHIAIHRDDRSVSVGCAIEIVVAGRRCSVGGRLGVTPAAVADQEAVCSGVALNTPVVLCAVVSLDPDVVTAEVDAGTIAVCSITGAFVVLRSSRNSDAVTIILDSGQGSCVGCLRCTLIQANMRSMCFKSRRRFGISCSKGSVMAGRRARAL